MDEASVNVSHLFKRAGFGGLQEEIDVYKHWPWDDVVELVLDTNRAPATGSFPDLSDDRSYYGRWVEMTHYWLDRARRPVDQAPVVEKMTLFWHGLLCSSLDKLFDHKMMMDQNHLFRVYGMGNYNDLLHRVSIGPAMIKYLDNDLNVAGNPNENFSRELMELFVTGVGHYTETDVVESARAWTGHTVDDDGNYVFDSGAHDWTNKTFMGRTGNFDGPDIINILLDVKRTEHARFMCHRLWSFFAYPVAAGDQVVTDIMGAYLPNLNIKDTLRAIFRHPQFKSEQAKTGLARSPIEYVVAAMRHTSTDCATAHPEWFLPGMGQMPFYPPNVSGWRQNDYWISAAAGWAKIHMASSLRWHAHHRDDVEDLVDVIDWNPRTYKYTPDQSIDRVLWNFKLGPINPTSRQKLLEYVHAERNSEHRWTERSGLLMLALLLPEMVMA